MELQAFAARRRSARQEAAILSARILPLRELFWSPMCERLLLIFAGAVAFVFLIACANFCQPAAHPRSFPSARARKYGRLWAQALAISASVGWQSTLLSWREVY